MKQWYLINEAGYNKLLGFLSQAKLKQDIQAWVIDAENQISLNNQCVLELRPWQTTSGRVESLVLNFNDFYEPLELIE